MIPTELKQLKNWLYCNEKNNAPADETGKIISWKNKDKWTTYNNKAKVFLLDNNYTIIDFDSCLDENGNIQSWAKDFVSPFLNKGFYVEYSRSKKGLHIIAKGVLPKNISIKMNQAHSKYKDLHKKSGIEIFINHPVTLTGNTYQNQQPENINNIDNNFKILFKYLEELKKRNTEKKQNYNTSTDLFEYIKSNVTLKSLLNYYNIEVSDKNISCPLPNHKDKKPSFRANFSMDLYYCYAGCGGGSVIDFVMKMENLNNLEAAKWIVDKFNLEIPVNNFVNNPQFVNETVDIFDQVNIKMSDIKKDEETRPLASGYFLPENYKTGYYMVKQGFCKRYIFKQTDDLGNKEELYADKILIPIKIFPTKIYIVNQFEEIEYNNKILVENDSFSSVAKFKTWLKQLGKTLWFDGETADLVGLEKYINIYRNISKIKPIKSASKMGWNDKSFTPYNGIDIFTKNDAPEIKNLLDSFEEKGNFETWKTNILKFSKNSTFKIYLNTSLAAPLISYIKRPSFWVHNYAKHSSGKTPALYAAASIFANPEKYAPSFNTTRVGLEFKLHMLGNMPCMFDDSQNLNEWSKKHISSLIYDVANGHGKTRGNIQGNVQESKFWYTTMLTNGEQELLNGNEFEGAIKRLMEFDTKPFKNHLEAREARNIFLNNYGFAGKLFIKKIIEQEENIRNMLVNIETLINNNTNYPTHIQNVSTMVICDYLFNVHVLNQDNEESFNNAVNWGKEILKQLPGEHETDKTTIAIDLIKEYIISNTHRFRQECPQGRVGFFKRGEVYFFPIEFKKLLNEWGVPPTRFIKELKEMDISITDKNKQFKAIKYNGRTIRPIGLINEDITDTIHNFDDYL